MILIQPKVEIIDEKDPFKKIELAGRTCYKSENKITEDSAIGFVSRLVNAGHLAMVEHASFCFMSETEDNNVAVILSEQFANYPFTNITLQKISNKYRVIFSANARALLECDLLNIQNKEFIFDEILTKNFKLVDFEKLKNKTEIEILHHRYVTMRFICDRGVSHELVRHRLFSFAQESQRYIKYDKKENIEFIKPCDYDSWDEKTKLTFNSALIVAENIYKTLRLYGRTAQEARGVLPNAIKTEVVVTGNFKEWKHFFELRCDKAAHPDIQIVANMAKEIYNTQFKVKK